MKPVLKLSLFAAGCRCWRCLGSQRLKLPRKASLEGLEDAEVTGAYDRISRWPQFAAMRHITAAYLARCGQPARWWISAAVPGC